MDQKERYNDMQAALRSALDGRQAQIWTMLPGIVQSVDWAKMTAVVQPSIQGKVQATDGSYSDVDMPELVDCPIWFPGGGDFILTFPIQEGDECCVFLASRCIDAWWQSGGVQPQAELRMHDLSDGFCFVGPNSQPRMVPNIDADSVALRMRDGSAFFKIKNDGSMTITAPGGLTVNADTVVNGDTTMNGNLQVNGTIDATGDISSEANVHADGDVSAGGNVEAGVDVTAAGDVNATNVNASGTVTAATEVVGGGKSLTTHIHSGVTSGGSNTGPPV